MVPNQLIAATIRGNLSGLGVPVTNATDATDKFTTYATQIIGTLTIVAVLYFIIQIIFAGYAFIASQGDEKTMEATRKRLTEAVLGLTVVIIAVGLGSLIAMLFGIDTVLNLEYQFTKMGL